MKFVKVVLALVVGNLVLHCSGEYIAEHGGLIEKLRPSHFNVDYPSLPYLLPGIQHSSDCSVPVKNLAKPQPLFIKPTTNIIWPYSDTGSIDLGAGETVEIYCHSYAKPAGKSGNLTATCVSGKTFKIDKAEYDLTKITCQDWPDYSARKNGTKCNGGVLVDVGFPVGSRFIKQMEICFDENEEVTRYVHHTLTPGIAYSKSHTERPKFITAGFFGGRDVDKMYSTDGVARSLMPVLGSSYGSYIGEGEQQVLTRGHLAAKSDFVYANEQRATFLFLNAAPQWSSFNGGNWEKVEKAVRNWVVANKLRVDCYTGVYGVSSLTDSKMEQKRLYLYYDERGNRIPVPILYFRVVIEPTSKRGVVLIGVNNPHIDMSQDKHVVCTDVAAKLTWLNWDRTHKVKGYSYACEVAEFAKVNPNLPKFDVKSLLV